MKLSQMTLNGSFSIDQKKVNNGGVANMQDGYETPRKNNHTRFMHVQQSATTLARTNSAGPKTFIKRVSKMKDNNDQKQMHKLSKKSSIKQIQSEEDKSHVSPLMKKNCFSRGGRQIMAVEEIKRNSFTNNNKNNHQSLRDSLEKREVSTQKRHEFYARQVQTQRKHYMTESITQNNINNINNNTNLINTTTNNMNRSLLPTNYTSVKLFMSTKFKKGIKQKIPINILAMPESIHEKQTQSQLSLSQVSQSKLMQTIVLGSKNRNI